MRALGGLGLGHDGKGLGYGSTPLDDERASGHASDDDGTQAQGRSVDLEGGEEEGEQGAGEAGAGSGLERGRDRKSVV